MSSELPLSRLRRFIPRILQGLLLVVTAMFVALHFVHLDADFPNHSPWMDWSKYTDEGWYGDAAIRHFQRGHWYVPGDFNPAAALPVWPLLEAIVFRFTGVSASVARALSVSVFALILVAAYCLIRRWSPSAEPKSGASSALATPSLAPAIAVLLLAVSPFCYVFTRLAILEPLLVLLTLVALLIASYLGPAEQGRRSLSHIVLSVALGLITTLMVLTKTTAIFVLPSLGWILWERSRYRLRFFLKISAIPATVAALTWLGYYRFIVRPHFLLDYRYLFSANGYTGITASTAVSVILDTISDGLWMGRLLFPLALLAILLAALTPRLFRSNPLVPALILWSTGYAVFLAYHNNLQPRYYLVIAVPMTMLVPIVFESLWRSPDPGSVQYKTKAQIFARPHPVAAAALVVALLSIVALDARKTIRFVLHPEYSFVTAAAQIKQIIAADHKLNPSHNPLVLSISGSNLSLMTGLSSICDDFGTMELPVRIQTYKPGWFVTWNQVDDDKMDALAPFYDLQRVAAFPVMDDPERNLLILYRLNPTGSSTPRKPRRRKPIPRILQTKIGQQPSETQLEH